MLPYSKQDTGYVDSGGEGRNVPCRIGPSSFGNSHQPTVFLAFHSAHDGIQYDNQNTCEEALTFRSLSDIAGNVGAKQRNPLVIGSRSSTRRAVLHWERFGR